jgi:hypothetical protein
MVSVSVVWDAFLGNNSCVCVGFRSASQIGVETQAMAFHVPGGFEGIMCVGSSIESCQAAIFRFWPD